MKMTAGQDSLLWIYGMRELWESKEKLNFLTPKKVMQIKYKLIPLEIKTL